MWPNQLATQKQKEQGFSPYSKGANYIWEMEYVNPE